jgi:hypothetical protein
VEWPLLLDLAPEAVRELLAIPRRRTFAKGEVVFHRNDLRLPASDRARRLRGAHHDPNRDSVLLRDEQKRGSVALQRGCVTLVDPGELARRRRYERS